MVGGPSSPLLFLSQLYFPAHLHLDQTNPYRTSFPVAPRHPRPQVVSSCTDVCTARSSSTMSSGAAAPNPDRYACFPVSPACSRDNCSHLGGICRVRKIRITGKHDGQSCATRPRGGQIPVGAFGPRGRCCSDGFRELRYRCRRCTSDVAWAGRTTETVPRLARLTDPPGFSSVAVVAADSLAKRDVFRLPDPFAVITVDGEQTNTTSAIKVSF